MNENEKDVKIENEDELFVPITQDMIQSEKIIAPRYSYCAVNSPFPAM